uniref:Uncharacterized protein n=1 Tax=Arundo donax TaxID=35708 RepID=A0A0A8ZYH1_ARUDO
MEVSARLCCCLRSCELLCQNMVDASLALVVRQSWSLSRKSMCKVVE